MFDLLKRVKNNKVVSSLVVVLAVALVLSVFMRRHSVSAVTFDVKGTLAQFTEQAAKQKMAKSARASLAKDFALAMKEGVSQYAKQYHVVVLVKGAVVSGAPDATHTIQAVIARIMVKNKREHSQGGARSSQKEIRLVG